MNHPSQLARLTPLTRHVRTTISNELHERIAHLAIDLNCTITELLSEGLLLLCRYHDVGEGLPEPEPPKAERLRIVRLLPVRPQR
jgi:hypothetical protein